VWHGVGDVRLDDAPAPTVQDPVDAIVEITAGAVCGTDLHSVRGTTTGVVEGTVPGHDAVGVVRETGPGVRDLRPGDRVAGGPPRPRTGAALTPARRRRPAAPSGPPPSWRRRR
jgi:threonine dehydrogenase-like Zn-dependent dehydrogenase